MVGVAMPKVKLSKSVVDKLKPEERDVVYWDRALRGFGVRIKANGTKSYVVQYRNRNSGRSKRKTVGQVGPLMSFAEARAAASVLLGEAMRGGDPVDDARATRSAERFAELSEQYLSLHAKPKKRAKSVANDVSMLNRIILPRLRRRQVAEISHREVQVLHNSLSQTPYQANRVLSLLSKIFELSVKWGMRTDNPAKGIDRFPEAKRHRWLSESELSQLMAALDRHPNQKAANAIRLQLLTGARIGEVLNARWGDFDLERGVWIKPSHHTKQKRTEHLPISGTAAALLQSMREQADQSMLLVFPGRDPSKPLRDLKRFWKAVTSDAGLDDYRIHDNRHTHASHLVSSGLSLAIVGKLLGHTNPLTTQRYAHLADDPLREAAEVMARKMADKSANS